MPPLRTAYAVVDVFDDSWPVRHFTTREAAQDWCNIRRREKGRTEGISVIEEHSIPPHLWRRWFGE